MSVSVLNDKELIEFFFRKDTDLNVYQIGDLDDFFWNYTVWYALRSDELIKEIILLYSGSKIPTFIAMSNDTQEMINLINEIKYKLPPIVYAHLSHGLESSFVNSHTMKSHGRHYKMAVKEEALTKIEKEFIFKKLDIKDYDEIRKFYELNYPDNWFDKRMLETGKYFSFTIDGDVAAVSGIHVYSPKYKVAALGNIATARSQRGKSVCTLLTSYLCKELFKTVDNIGLNVHIENIAAIKCYEKVGFRIVGEYEEFVLEVKQ